MPTTPADGGERLLDGRYRLGERLGSGAVAEVFRAVDDRLQRPVAVKVFRGDAAQQLQRHDAEMRTLAALDHPSLVTVFDAGTDADSGQPYLVMQLVEGPTLADELRGGALTTERAARYGAALADALAYVHERGLVHRDVKPANVLISDDGRVHLADFGIARLVDSAHETRTGDVLGTPAYFAPEQVASEPVGPPADVYALGIVLLECLTGHRPFQGTAMEVAMARLAKAPDVPAELSPGWRSLLSAMTRRDPQDRPSSNDVAESLRLLADDENSERTIAMMPPARSDSTRVMPPIAAETQAVRSAPGDVVTAPPHRRRSPAALVVVLVVAIIAAVVVAVVVATQQDNGGNGVKHGKPKLDQPLERDVRQLENLVHR